MLSPLDVDGIYPVTALIEPFGFHAIASVLATPVAVVVTTVAQAPEAIAEVPRADVPLAIVCVQLPLEAVQTLDSPVLFSLTSANPLVASEA